MRLITRFLSAGIFAGLCVPAAAVDFGVSLTTTAEYSTNSRRTARDEVEEWIFRPGLRLEAFEQTPNLQIDGQYFLSREFYQQSDQLDRNLVTGQANLNWSALPDRLDFVVNHARSETQINAIENFGPDNQQSFEQTSAGPLLRFDSRGQDEIQLQYLWGTRDSDRGFDDAVTHNTTARYILVTSLTNSFTLEATNSQVQYENPLSPDIDYKLAQLSWNRIGPNSRLGLTAGRKRADRSQISARTETNTFDLSFDRELSASTSLQLGASRDLDDRPQQLNDGLGPQDFFEPINTGQVDVFVEERAFATLNHAINARNTLTMTASAFETSYEILPLDTSTQQLLLQYRRLLQRNLSADIFVRLEDREFPDQNEEQDRRLASLRLTWDFAPTMTASFTATYDEVDSDSTLLRRGYDEWRGLLTFTYTPLRVTRN